jgi:hypothetical protein
MPSELRRWFDEQHALVWKVRLEWQPMLRRWWKLRFQIELQKRN